jgi:hypothetical protein
MSGSDPRGPAIYKPTGRPSTNPQGTVIAGMPRKLNIMVWLVYTGAKLPPGKLGLSTVQAASHFSTVHLSRSISRRAKPSD